MNISNNLSSMNASFTLLNNSVNNIANINTENYKRIDTHIVNDNGNVKAISSKSDRGNLLIQDLIDQKLARFAFEFNTKIIQTKNEIDNTLLDI